MAGFNSYSNSNLSNVNFYQELASRHGPEKKREARIVEREFTKCVKLQCKYEFLVQCKGAKVFPRNIAAKLPKHSHPAAQKIIFETNRKIINICIKEGRKEHFLARKNALKIHEQFLATLNDTEKHTYKHILDTKLQNTQHEQEKHKNHKLKMMIKNTDKTKKPTNQTKNKQNTVTNLSDKTLTTEQTIILSKGPKFSITPKSIPSVDIITGFETAPPGPEKDSFIAHAHKYATQNRRIKQNVTEGERAALKQLKRDNSIIVLTADKGGSTVIMNRDDYDSKMTEIVSNPTDYEKVDPKFPEKTKKALEKLCSRLKTEKLATADEINSIKPGDTYKTPHIYGAPKIHKPNIPLRPIVSTIDSSTRKLENYIKNILTPLTNNSKYNIKNANQALLQIQEQKVTQNTRCCSYDVVNMFNNIPRNLLLETLKNRLENDTTLADRTTMAPTTICELIDFTLKTTHFQYKEDIFVQKSGLAMGSKISPILADICMEKILEKALEKQQNKPTLLIKYVDDCLCIFENDQMTAENLLQTLNSIDQKIQFTLEEEKDEKLPYLDILIEREQQKFNTKVYRKPTDKGILLNYNSNHSHATKSTVVRSGLMRAYNYCKEKTDRQNEISKVYQDLTRNDYPTSFIKRVHQKVISYLNSKKQKHTQNTTNDSTNTQTTTHTNPTESQKQHTIVIPFVKEIASAIQKVTKKCFPNNVRIAFTSKDTIRKNVNNVKPKSKIKLNNLLYKVNCKICPSTYIGQTKRNVKTRLKEHKAALKKPQDENFQNHNRIALHAQKYNHDIDFEGASIIHHENNYRRRLATEALAMVAHENVISQTSLKPSSIWTQIMKEKGKKFFKQKPIHSPPPPPPRITIAQVATALPASAPQGNKTISQPPTHTYSLRPRKPRGTSS
jgi:hypothetical protein